MLERRKGEASVLREFEQAGELVICDEFGQDIADIAQLAHQIDENGLLHAVALDPYGVGAIVDAMDETGISGEDRIVGISQGWKLTGAIKTAERKLADGSLRHSGQGLMAWAVANARVEPKGNAVIIAKQASGSAKIDPLMAAFNAIVLMSTLGRRDRASSSFKLCRGTATTSAYALSSHQFARAAIHGR
jgi:phage terminase large subunit-like protein